MTKKANEIRIKKGAEGLQWILFSLSISIYRRRCGRMLNKIIFSIQFTSHNRRIRNIEIFCMKLRVVHVNGRN